MFLYEFIYIFVTSILGAVFITMGLYSVLWGKGEEERMEAAQQPNALKGSKDSVLRDVAVQA